MPTRPMAAGRRRRSMVGLLSRVRLGRGVAGASARNANFSSRYAGPDSTRRGTPGQAPGHRAVAPVARSRWLCEHLRLDVAAGPPEFAAVARMTSRTSKTLPKSSPRSAVEPPAAAPAPVRDREFVRGLKRGFAVILAFEDALTPLTATEVSARTGLTRAVARRYLMTLKALGYIDKIGSSFALTPRVLNLGFKNLSSINVADVALPFMRNVVDTLRESCSLGVLDGHDVVYAARLTADRIMTTRLQVGSRLPAHATAMGRVLLAYLPAEQLAAYFATAELRP